MARTARLLTMVLVTVRRARLPTMVPARGRRLIHEIGTAGRNRHPMAGATASRSRWGRRRRHVGPTMTGN